MINRFGPSKKLTKEKPISKLISKYVLVKIFGQVIIQAIFQSIIYFYIASRSEYDLIHSFLGFLQLQKMMIPMFKISEVLQYRYFPLSFISIWEFYFVPLDLIAKNFHVI